MKDQSLVLKGYLSIFLRRMKSRWGSCSDRGRINLKIDLVKVPKRYIDYVITHELCHLKEPNNGPDFTGF